jgi:PAB1-binding protein PBP1
MEQSLLQTRQETAMTTTRDPFAAARRDRGEISQQDYERQVAELEQAEQDFRRGQDLEREMPPGEVDQEIDETD